MERTLTISANPTGYAIKRMFDSPPIHEVTGGLTL
jgi:hypothetical protein